jgi:hypothetical protein
MWLDLSGTFDYLPPGHDGSLQACCRDAVDGSLRTKRCGLRRHRTARGRKEEVGPSPGGWFVPRRTDHAVAGSSHALPVRPIIVRSTSTPTSAIRYCPEQRKPLLASCREPTCQPLSPKIRNPDVGPLTPFPCEK